MAQRSILIVGTEKLYAKAMASTLEAFGYSAQCAWDSDFVLNTIQKETTNLVICEENMHPITGTEIMHKIHAIDASIPVILISDYGSVERAVKAMRDGAADYLIKPIDTDHLLELVERVATSPAPNIETDSDMIAHDPYSLELIKLAKKVAEKDVSVLISGESGTGKEVLARYVHKHSLRKNKPFIAINCAAIPENMLEAILFGYEKGAYTGAHQANSGKFEQAQGGTILLDEISEMDLSLQAKLLRVLQEKEVERLGSHETIQLNVRVLATTNRNLRAEVDAGRFREDLYYRLNVFPLDLLPLRSRPADIVPLADHLIKTHVQIGQPRPVIAAPAAQQLEKYSWPGNVRELSNVIQRALVMHSGNIVEAEDLRFEAHQGNSSDIDNIIQTSQLNRNLKSREHELILTALEKGNGSRKLAAEELGISPRTLRYKLAKMRDLGLEIPTA
ncbi:MAG TPA: sigma-54-dependent Fis family transcriptional regulator [Gammaproteobacteria bacterium]|jgi:two-component system response regulator FlrC|nr:sigma-54-dependent Fis family transcriptional regulator [Gammaproteobacteria bacterium]